MLDLKKSGFSLVELMVVVAIIGIIATVAVPNFLKFQAKAKQANAKSELSGIYMAQKIFYNEYGIYHYRLNYIGYVPDGLPLNDGNCVETSDLSLWPTRYYTTGIAPPSFVLANDSHPGYDSIADRPEISCLPSEIESKFISVNGSNVFLSNGTEISPPDLSNVNFPGTFVPVSSLSVGGQFFRAGAVGIISGSMSSNYDFWTMDNKKQLENRQSGL